MTASEREVVAALDRFAGRLAIVHALEAAAMGGAAAAVVSGVGRWNGASVAEAAIAGVVPALVVGGVRYWSARGGRTQAAAAAAVERRHPVFRNLVITAAELHANPERARPWMRARVMDDTARAIREHASGIRFEATRPLVWFVSVWLLWLAGIVGVPGAALSTVRSAAFTLAERLPGARPPVSLQLTIEPPAYTRLPTQTLDDPDRVETVEGSRLRLAGRGDWRIRFGDAVVASARRGDSTVAETVLTRSGYLAIEPATRDDRTAARLIAVSVSADRKPTVQVERPGRDLLLPTAGGHIPLHARATDDFGLTSFELRYTKVSGTGEQFEFVEGTLPVTLVRDNDKTWNAAGGFDLSSLRLDKGDSLVYRLVARDGRPGSSGIGASDTYFIEIAGPGRVALAGVDMPPERERYALSQQMIVLKIERLRAREATLDRAALGEEVETIAAEQRAVRANFIFLMGGHVEDEEVEAEQSHEIQEGRLENRARRDIAAAVQHMTRAERELAAVNTGAALPAAKAAVDALQRALGHSRYILRALPVRSRIDPSRRLARAADVRGEWIRDPHPGSEPTVPSRARALLARLAGGEVERLDAARVARLAEEALAIDPASQDWQDISRRLLRLRDAIAAGAAAAERQAALDAAVTRLAAQAEADALPRAGAVGRRTRLFSAWTEQKRP